MSFAEQYDPVQTLRLRRKNESLSVGIQIWGACRKFESLSAAVLQHLAKRLGVQRVAVEDQLANALRETVFGIRQVPRDLLHPLPRGRVRDPNDFDLTRLDIDHEEDEVADEAP